MFNTNESRFTEDPKDFPAGQLASLPACQLERSDKIRRIFHFRTTYIMKKGG
jgi:hypothetical protein